MNLNDIHLKAGEVFHWPVSGGYLRFLTAMGDLSVEALYSSGQRVSGAMIAGIGVNLAEKDTGQPFRELYITSGVDQTVRVLASDFETTDSRSVGRTNIAPNTQFVGLPRIELDGSVQTISSNSERAQIELYADDANAGVVWIGGIANSGFPLKSGGTYQPMISGKLEVLGSVGDFLYVSEII